MRQWKKLSFERQKMVHHSAMILVAKEGKAKSLLNFDGKKWLCPNDASFTLTLDGGVTGTVRLSNCGDSNWARVMVDFKTVFIEGFMSVSNSCLKINWLWSVYSKGGIPEAIVDMALNPVSIDEALA